MTTDGLILPFTSTNSERPTALPFDERLAGISEIVAWWCADAARVTLVSGAVSALSDRSAKGNNAAQATVSRRPTWTADSGNGWPCMQLDRANTQSLDCGSILPIGAGAKWTKVISVYAPTAVGSSEQHDILSGANTSSSSVGLHRLNIRNTNQIYCRVGTDSARAELTGTALFGQWMLLMQTWNDDDKLVRLSINGGAFAAGTVISGASCTESVVYMGRVAGGNAFNGKVGPGFIFNVDLSKSAYSGLLSTVKDFYRNREGMTIS